MQTYEILVQDRSVRGNSADMTLVRTSIGIDQAHVLFDNAEWLAFPITITFAQGDVIKTQALTVSEVTGSSEWVAEATVTIPYEVIEMVGPIRVTIQGTDADGRHIITAKGSPLSVEEAGDVTIGEMPSDVPTIDQWNQAYANAQIVTNETRSVLSSFQESVDTILQTARDQMESDVQGAVDTILGTYAVPATTESLGLVQVGDGLRITEAGVLMTLVTNGITVDERFQLENLARLAAYCFDTEFDDDGILRSGAKVKPVSVPLEDIVDGTSIVVADGKISLGYEVADSIEY